MVTDSNLADILIDMDKKAFKLLQESEDSWVHLGRKWSVLSAIQASKIDVPKNTKVIDVGAGFGSMYGLLSKFGAVDAVEIEPEARAHCKRRGYKEVYPSLDKISANDTYDVLGAFEVIEHVEDDIRFVKNLSDKLNDSGVILASVPAYQWMWSKHDETHGHFRRYTSDRLRKLFLDAGFTDIYATYWNTTLFPAAALLRLFNKTGESAVNANPVVETILRKIIRLETRLLKFVKSPYGVGIILIARKSIN